jgi:hypothetical protein
MSLIDTIYSNAIGNLIMFNASIFEKIVLGGLVTSTAVFTCWSIFRDP